MMRTMRMRRIPWWARFVLAPAVLGLLLSANVDATALPFVSPERITGVLLLDGQAYFGHLDDGGSGGTIRLSDAYYFQDARQSSTNLPLGLVKRGGEAHQPAEGMSINRDRVLAVERLSPTSAVVGAIAAQRGLGKDTAGSPIERRLAADQSALNAQRQAAENALARGFANGVAQLRKTNELKLPISAAEATSIINKAIDDLRAVRRAALGAIAASFGFSQSDADVYVRTTEPRLESPPPGSGAVLLAPELYGVTARADQLYGQVTDDAIRRMTQRQNPSPSPSSSPPSPSPSPSSRP